MDGGFTRLSESDEESEEEEDERKEAPKQQSKQRKPKKTEAEKEAEELRIGGQGERVVNKRVKMPDDQADGDPGTIVKVERRKEQKTRKRKGKTERYTERQWWFKVDWDDAEEEDGKDP